MPSSSWARGVDPDGTASSELMSRTYHAMDLYQAGMAPVVICAGGAGGDRLAAGAVACRFAQQELGLPADSALVAQDADAWTRPTKRPWWPI